jgi:cytochrome c oxidase cbb3-type subunit I
MAQQVTTFDAKTKIAALDPNLSDDRALERRSSLDRMSSLVVLSFILPAVAWLLFGSVLGLLASLKLHLPDWLGGSAWLTFGRIRPLHLNTMAYGWAAMVGTGVGLWIMSRSLATPIPARPAIFIGAVVWNVMLVIGSVQILSGNSRGLEWLEMPVYVMVAIAIVVLLVAECAIAMVYKRRIEHLYISVWYILAAFICVPLLGIVTSLPIFEGTVQAGMNWWYAHNALGLLFTPIGLATAYYLIPKVTGKPIYSYPLSALGFWSLLLFYNWNGFHHLIGGPVPTWLVTVSIAASVMMMIPVLTVAVNQHFTILGAFEAVVHSPTLRFVVFGAMSYTFVSLQGSLQALRTVNETIHFTHFVIAHAHIGMYAFFSMIMFGAVYYILPRITSWEWHSPAMIKLHFWLSAIGIMIYVVGLQVGGVIQGMEMNNPNIPFMTVVNNTKNWLISRSFAGTLMTAGHLVFAYNVFRLMHLRRERPPAPKTWLEVQKERGNAKQLPLGAQFKLGWKQLKQDFKNWANNVDIDEH